MQDLHKIIVQRSAALRVQRSTSTHTTSRHVLLDSVPLSSIKKLGELLKQERRLGDACIGTVDGEIVLTIGDQLTPEPRKKRKADLAAEGAARAIARVRRASDVKDEALEAAEAALTRLCRIKGLNLEEAIDSFAVSSRAIPSDSSAVVIGARLYGGIAFSLKQLVEAAEAAPDGVVTVSAVDSFELPRSNEATIAERSGQKTLLVFLNFK